MSDPESKIGGGSNGPSEFEKVMKDAPKFNPQTIEEIDEEFVRNREAKERAQKAREVMNDASSQRVELEYKKMELWRNAPLTENEKWEKEGEIDKQINSLRVEGIQKAIDLLIADEHKRSGFVEEMKQVCKRHEEENEKTGFNIDDVDVAGFVTTGMIGMLEKSPDEVVQTIRKMVIDRKARGVSSFDEATKSEGEEWTKIIAGLVAKYSEKGKELTKYLEEQGIIEESKRDGETGKDKKALDMESFDYLFEHPDLDGLEDLVRGHSRDWDFMLHAIERRFGFIDYADSRLRDSIGFMRKVYEINPEAMRRKARGEFAYRGILEKIEKQIQSEISEGDDGSAPPSEEEAFREINEKFRQLRGEDEENSAQKQEERVKRWYHGSENMSSRRRSADAREEDYIYDADKYYRGKDEREAKIIELTYLKKALSSGTTRGLEGLEGIDKSLDILRKENKESQDEQIKRFNEFLKEQGDCVIVDDEKYAEWLSQIEKKGSLERKFGVRILSFLKDLLNENNGADRAVEKIRSASESLANKKGSNTSADEYFRMLLGMVCKYSHRSEELTKYLEAMGIDLK